MFLVEWLAQGGWPMAPIYACSVVAMAAFVRKTLQIHSLTPLGTVRLEGIMELIRAGNEPAVAKACAKLQHPAAVVVCAAVATGLRQPERAEAEAQRAGESALADLERGVGLLGFIAQAAPLLGLLGTVLGMVDLFASLEGNGLASVNASLLAAGIWKALLTTAAGLTVAVPCLAGHAWLTSRMDRVRAEMNGALVATITALARGPVPAPVSHKDPSPIEGLVVREVAHGV